MRINLNICKNPVESLGKEHPSNALQVGWSTLLNLQAAPVKVTQVFPDGKTVYAFTFDKSKFKWVAWGDLLDPTPIPADAEYTNIIVPTVDTVRYTFLLDQLVRSKKHCLLVGPTGTGKTAYIKKHLQGGLPDSFVPLFFNFSAQTSANMTQVGPGCLLELSASLAASCLINCHRASKHAFHQTAGSFQPHTNQ